MVGAGYSRLSTLMSFILQNHRIPQCCGASTSPALADKIQYPNVFGTIPNDNQQAAAIADYAFRQGWKKIAVVNTDEDYGNALAATFSQLSRSFGVQVVARASIQLGISSEAAVDALYSVKQSGALVVVFFGFPEELKTVLEVAKVQGLYGEGFVWMASEANMDISTLYPTETRLFSGLLLFYPTEGQGQVYQEFLQYWRENRLNTPYEFLNMTNVEPTVYSGFSTSCVDLLIYGFDRLLKSNPAFDVIKLQNRELNQYAQVPYTFNFPELETPTGKVFLDSNGVREGDFNIFNVDKQGNISKVAKWSKLDGITFIKEITYPGGTTKKPLGGVDPFQVAEYVEIESSTGILGIILFALGMILNISFGWLIYRYRKSDDIKELNLPFAYLILTSISAAYVQLWAILGKPSDFSCIASVVIIPISFSFCYGLLLSKSNTIYNNFFGYSIKKPQYSELRLICYGSLWVIPVIVIALIWNIYDPPKPTVLEYADDKYYWTCSSASQTFQTGMLALMLLHTFLLILSHLVITLKIFGSSHDIKLPRFFSYSLVNVLIIGLLTLMITFSPTLSFRIRKLLQILTISYCLILNVGILFGYRLYMIINGTQPKSKENTAFKESYRARVTDIIVRDNESNLKDWKYLSKVWLKCSGLFSRIFQHDQVKYMVLSSDSSMIVFFDFIPKESDPVFLPSVATIAWSIWLMDKLEVTKVGDVSLLVKIEKQEYMIKFISEKALITWFDLLKNWKNLPELPNNLETPPNLPELNSIMIHSRADFVNKRDDN